ncbi:MAG: hypothetical protein C4289_16540, partial [Chloroflexota bacterium]
GNWPTAEAIDARIALSEQQNGRRSPLHGTGAEFLRLGAKYGVNPGIVCAILQRESQLASDGSFLPTNANNFGGLTGAGPCGSVFYIDRNWAVFCDPAQGLDAIADVVIENGRIRGIAVPGQTAAGSPDGALELDARGLVVCPGFIDLHAHLREPGFEDKETIATGTRAAAAG